MSDTNPNNPTAEELSAQLTALRAGLAKGFGLEESTVTDEVLLARAGEVAKERDEARSKAADVESRWASEKVETALRSAFEKSGAGREHEEDFLLLARGLFEADEKGVRTRKDAPNTVPGVNAEAWIVAELRVKRSHWWPLSQGAGARGAGFIPSAGADDSCFDPRSPNYNFTAQLAAEAKYGPAFADRARQRFGGRGGAR